MKDVSVRAVRSLSSVSASRWYVQRGVAIEEALRLQMETNRLYRHNRPILGTHDMVRAEGVPDHQVRLFQRPILLDVGRKLVAPLLLVRVVSSRVALRRVVGRHPEMSVCEASALPLR